MNKYLKNLILGTVAFFSIGATGYLNNSDVYSPDLLLKDMQRNRVGALYRDPERLKKLREASKNADRTTIKNLRNPKYMKEHHLDFVFDDRKKEEDKYTREDCLRCSFLTFPEAKEIAEISNNFNLPNFLVEAKMYAESRHNPRALSKKGAVGEGQLRKSAVKEICTIYQNIEKPYERFEDFVDENKLALLEYKDWFQEDAEIIWNHLKKRGKDWKTRKPNWITSITNLAYMYNKCNKDLYKTLGSYLMGIDGFNGNPETAATYIDDVLFGQGLYGRCQEVIDEEYRTSFEGYLQSKYPEDYEKLMQEPFFDVAYINKQIKAQ
jgi:hypothetical protein